MDERMIGIVVAEVEVEIGRRIVVMMMIRDEEIIVTIVGGDTTETMVLASGRCCNTSALGSSPCGPR